MKSKLNNTKIGAAIREVRVSAGITQLQLSKKLQRTQSFLSTIETGAIRPSMKAVQQICKALHVSPKELISMATGIKNDAELINIIFDYYKHN